MTSTPEEPSTRRAGEVEEQDLTWAPPSYAGPDPVATGRWRMLGDDAFIWTDDNEGAGVLWLGRSELVAAINKHFQTAKHAGFSAATAYELAATRAGETASKETEGPLQGALDVLSALMDSTS